jgi:pilus assembly protein Flp/PilA
VKTAPLHEDRGASAVEYGILLGGIAAVVVAAIFALGAVIGVQYTSFEECYEQGAAC